MGETSSTTSPSLLLLLLPITLFPIPFPILRTTATVVLLCMTRSELSHRFSGRWRGNRREILRRSPGRRFWPTKNTIGDILISFPCTCSGPGIVIPRISMGTHCLVEPDKEYDQRTRKKPGPDAAYRLRLMLFGGGRKEEKGGEGGRREVAVVQTVQNMKHIPLLVSSNRPKKDRRDSRHKHWCA